MQYRGHAQLTSSCGVRLPFAKALHRSKEGLSGAALYSPGIGHAVCWKALNVVRRVSRHCGASGCNTLSKRSVFAFALRTAHLTRC